MVQIDKSAYKFDHYINQERWASYYYQLREIFAAHPSSVLEVGPGNGVVGDMIRHAGIAYTSVDIAEDLHPDTVASVTNIPFPDGAFDVVCAFEVLEHLPFEDFDAALAELARVSEKYILISLPHFGPAVRFLIKLPLLPESRVTFKIPFPKAHLFNGQHYWEIGKRGYRLARIRTMLRKYFVTHKEFVPFENQYHRFFVLQKKL